jgi:AmmeMemoRadiSam system protein B
MEDVRLSSREEVTVKRKAAVAGYFYPSQTEALRDTVGRMVDANREKTDAICVVSPHAGFEYSGPVAGAVFSSVLLPDKFVLIGPSHRHARTRFAIMHKGAWETPFGDVSVDPALAEAISNQTDMISEDDAAHAREHSLEVQLPFIQFFKKDISIVPISISFDASFEDLKELGEAVACAVKEIGDKVLIVASTDMSHYVHQDEAKEKDFHAIDKILQLDPRGLYDVVNAENISMCGFQPTASGIVAALNLGAKKAELIKYQTSGDVTGDYREVVGYAGIRIR